jgi:hypothetical protein
LVTHADGAPSAGAAWQIMEDTLTSDTANPALRHAIVERFGKKLPDVALALAESKDVPFDIRIAALSSLAEHTLHLDPYGFRMGSAAEIG